MAYTHLKPGVELEITARAYFESASADMSSLVQLSPETLKEREEASAAQEEVIYDEAQAVIQKWYAQAAQTINYRKAQEYLKVCPVSHTSNQWTVDQHGRHEMSNMVYCFSWREYERTEWSRAEQKSVVVAWDLSWSLHFNTTQNPDYSGSGRRLAGQDRKVFKDRQPWKNTSRAASPPTPTCLRKSPHTSRRTLGNASVSTGYCCPATPWRPLCQTSRTKRMWRICYLCWRTGI